MPPNILDGFFEVLAHAIADGIAARRPWLWIGVVFAVALLLGLYLLLS